MSDQSNVNSDHGAAILDVRPDLERGDEPFARIMEAAAAIPPGERLTIIAPFEPVPLYAVLGARGFTHATEHVAPDEWLVQFTRTRPDGEAML